MLSVWFITLCVTLCGVLVACLSVCATAHQIASTGLVSGHIFRRCASSFTRRRTNSDLFSPVCVDTLCKSALSSALRVIVILFFVLSGFRSLYTYIALFCCSVYAIVSTSNIITLAGRQSLQGLVISSVLLKYRVRLHRHNQTGARCYACRKCENILCLLQYHL